MNRMFSSKCVGQFWWGIELLNEDIYCLTVKKKLYTIWLSYAPRKKWPTPAYVWINFLLNFVPSVPIKLLPALRLIFCSDYRANRNTDSEGKYKTKNIKYTL